MPTEPRPPLPRRLLSRLSRPRLRPVHLRWLDRLLAGAYGLPLLAYTVVRDDPLAVPGVVAVAVAVAQRRRRPLTALAVLLVVAPLCIPLWVAFWTWPYALYLVATDRPVRVSLSALAASLVPAVVVLLWAPWLDAVRLGYVAVLTLAPTTAWTVGYTVRQHRAYAEALRRYRAQRTAADAERERRALSDERLRIARELHDVVAHTMGVVTVQAGFGVLVIDERPDLARAALTAVEAAGREALTELRRLLGVLRGDGTAAGADRCPAPGLGAVDRLLAQTAQAGVRVTLRVSGDPRPLPPGLDLAAYRIVQESVTNIVRHAGTTAGTVAIHYGGTDLTIEVTDEGRGGPVAAGGHGLVGMRERVAMYGGGISAAPHPDGGFRVSARLPLTAEPVGAAPSTATPDHATPDHATPDHATPDHATPDHATPGTTGPGTAQRSGAER